MSSFFSPTRCSLHCNIYTATRLISHLQSTSHLLMGRTPSLTPLRYRQNRARTMKADPNEICEIFSPSPTRRTPTLHSPDPRFRDQLGCEELVDVSDFECDELHNEVGTKERDTTLHMALSRLAGDFGRESMLSLQRFFSSRCLPVISTGSLKLDIALGIGGLPKGRIVEIYGQEASGKTTLALHVIKEAQKLGGYCAYLDVENAMDPSLAEAIGVNTENLLISQPDSAENLLCMVDTLTKSGSVDVIVVDSVAALVPQHEIDVLIGDNYKCMQSQIMTQALRKIRYSLCQSQTIIVFVNQVRSNIKSVNGFGHAEEVTCGGNALPFHAAIRMRISRTGLIKSGEKATGLSISVQIVKNKLSPPMKKAEVVIHFGRGICCESEVLDLSCEHGLIVEEGNQLLIEGNVLTCRLEAERYLAKNAAVFDSIVKSLRHQLFEGDA